MLTALFVSEFAPPSFSRQVKLWLDVLNGFPSIVIGIFVFTIAVKQALPVLGIGHHQSAIAGGVGLAVIMLPLVARSTMEVLALVPNDLREASLVGAGLPNRAEGHEVPLAVAKVGAGFLPVERRRDRARGVVVTGMAEPLQRVHVRTMRPIRPIVKS